MTQAELYSQLKSIGYPVAYHHFEVSEDNPSSSLPYIVYFRASDDNISSDFLVHGKSRYYNVELYTDIKDLEAEKRVEAVLSTIDTDYSTNETYIESERLYQVVYQIKILEKR